MRCLSLDSGIWIIGPKLVALWKETSRILLSDSWDKQSKTDESRRQEISLVDQNQDSFWKASILDPLYIFILYSKTIK